MAEDCFNPEGASSYSVKESTLQVRGKLITTQPFVCAGRYSSDITYQELAQYFHLPSTEACREIGLGLTAFKSVCRRFGLAMWPYKRPRKSHPMIWSEHHADPALREKKSDSKAVTRENSSQNQRSPDVRLDSDTAQRGLTAKPRSRSQVEHLQARDGDKKQYQAVPTVRSELNTDILKQILKYRERRNVSHTPRSLRREQPRKDSLVLSGVHQDMMMAASTSGMHGSEHARAMLSKVEHDLAQQKEIMNQDIRAKSMDLNDIMKFNQMVYLWNVLLLLDSIQDDYDDAGAS